MFLHCNKEEHGITQLGHKISWRETFHVVHNPLIINNIVRLTTNKMSIEIDLEHNPHMLYRNGYRVELFLYFNWHVECLMSINEFYQLQFQIESFTMDIDIKSFQCINAQMPTKHIFGNGRVLQNVDYMTDNIA